MMYSPISYSHCQALYLSKTHDRWAQPNTQLANPPTTRTSDWYGCCKFSGRAGNYTIPTSLPKFLIQITIYDIFTCPISLMFVVHPNHIFLLFLLQPISPVQYI